jgi:HlyD family secretion protein
MASTFIHAVRIACATALGLGTLALLPGAQAQDQRPARTDAAARKWAATAPGRIEPRSHEVRVGSSVPGRIVDVRVKPNDKVAIGDLLVRLDDEEARARLAAAEAQVIARQRVRDDARVKGPADLRRAEDDLYDAARSVSQAWDRLDAISVPKDAARSAVDDAAVGGARSALTRAQDLYRQRQDAQRKARDESGLPTREEAELAAARAELALADVALQKTRIRAPIAGSALQVRARVGEMAMPSPEAWLVLLGDVTGLSVRAELDEQDFAKVKVGQRVVVRAYAFPGRDFEGQVRSIARYVGPGRLGSPTNRSKMSDVEVAEVVIDLSDPGPLAVGMQADVYFNADTEQAQAR